MDSSTKYLWTFFLQVPPPSLGIRIIGVNMIHGVPDKLNIYVKKVMPDSVAGRDARIRVDDHIVEVVFLFIVSFTANLSFYIPKVFSVA